MFVSRVCFAQNADRDMYGTANALLITKQQVEYLQDKNGYVQLCEIKICKQEFYETFSSRNG